MKKLLVLIAMLLPMFAGFAYAEVDTEAPAQYNFIARLHGDWKLLPASMQEGKTTKNKIVAPLVGTDQVAMSFKVIGKGSTVQENLLPGTKKEMATMYHCNAFKNCTQIQAKHYCAKQNQPEFKAESRPVGNKLELDCDMENALCKSKAGHVHKITHELVDGSHLKTTYTIFKNGKFKKNSIYHFSRI